jgi:hypothetical protein
MSNRQETPGRNPGSNGDKGGLARTPGPTGFVGWKAPGVVGSGVAPKPSSMLCEFVLPVT